MQVNPSRILALTCFALLQSPVLFCDSDSAPKNFRELGQLDIDAYYFNINDFVQNKQWRRAIIMGKNAFEGAVSLQKLDVAWKIGDTLVSHNFFLGDFEEALRQGLENQKIAELLAEPKKMAKSLYKISAAYRGIGDSSSIHSESQIQSFQKSRDAIKKSLQIAEEKCPLEQSLRAKILFNLGALESQDPKGDLTKAKDAYTEAIVLFERTGREDYRQRTLLRLGKLYLLQKNLIDARATCECLRNLVSDERSLMHFFYLDAQILSSEGNWPHACESSEKALALAIKLEAKADIQRIQEFFTNKEK